MPTDVVMPQMGESITEGTLTKWLKKPGDTVARDEPLFEISTDKVDAEIPSPTAGTLGEIKVQEGATVTINTVVCTINEEGASSSAPAPKEDTVTPAAVATAAKDVAASAAAVAPVTGAGTEVTMPQMGESITEGTITKWLKKVGDTVARDEPIFEISTDKVDAEIPSPVAGTLTEIKVQEGATVTINTVVAVISGAAAAPQSAAPVAAPPVATQAVQPAVAPQLAASASAGEGQRSSPLVRKIAKENNVDLSAVAATGASGRITKQDILGHLEGGAASAPKPAATATPAAPAKPANSFR
jgi:pyruvate dehydrogenase E2 component (dihydrolipoamide acetyltransferase)